MAVVRARLRTATRSLVRSSGFGALHETLLITAVATVLVIRTQLWLTHYPQLGGHGLHIAHLLWGGLFMLVAIGLLLTFLGRHVRRAAAVVGGIGFGFFIDELGKFITSDNNYFYKPAAALIYLIFVALFLLARWAQRCGPLSERERVANVVDLVAGAVRGGLTAGDRRAAIALLDGTDPTDPLVPRVRALVGALEPLPPAQPSWLQRWAADARALEARLTNSARFPDVLTAVFALWALLSLLAATELALALVFELGGAHPDFLRDGFRDLRFVNIASISASFVAALFVVHGIRRLRAGDRSDAVVAFQRALVISIFVVQVFAFYESQFGAIFGLAIDLLLLAGVRRLAHVDARDPTRARPLPAT